MSNEDTKKYAVIGVVVALIILLIWLVTGDAKAQTAISGSHSGSNSSANVNTTSGAYAGGGSVYIAPNPTSTRSRVDYEQSGKYTVRSAPAVQAPSMGSGHPCALSGSVGISIIGGGVSGGNMKIDEACLLAQMGQGEAALLMIARRDSEACMALRSVGRIPASSICKQGETVAAVPAKTANIPTCPTGSKWDGKGCWMPKKR